MKKLLLLTATLFCFQNLVTAQTDRPDSAFGTNGIVKTDLGKTFNYGAVPAGQILPLPDGSIYIVHQNYGTYQNYISKRHSDGSVDSSFGTNGQSADAGLLVTQAALEPDGKVVVTGSVGTDFAVSRYNTNGTLDSSFSDDGKQTTDLGESSNESSWSVAIQKDNKILVAGFSYTGVYTYLSMVRYNTDGSPDSAFGNNGALKTNFVTYSALPQIALQDDGKIVISYYANLVRLNADGSIDSTFVMNPIQDAHGIISLAIQSNGKIVAVGDNGNVLYRYNNDGSADKSFGNDGVVSNNTASYPYLQIAIQNDDKILVLNARFLTRYNTDGSLDDTFKNKMENFFDVNSDAKTVAIRPDGKIWIGGAKNYAEHFYSVNLALARYNTDGKPDSTFDEDGEFVYGLHAGNAVYTNTVVQKDGKLVAAGRAWNDSTFDYIITRYNADGSLDKTFGNRGIVTTGISFEGPYDEYKIYIAIQNDGKIVAVGGYGPERYNADGSVDQTFVIDRKRLIDARHYIKLAAIQTDGKIVVTEIDYGSGPQGDEFNSWLTRYNANGSLNVTYGVNGMQKVDYAPTSIAVQSDDKILAAGGNFGQVIERFNADGTLDQTFNFDGKAYFPAGQSLSSIVIQSDGKIIAAGDDLPGFLLWRFNTDGSLDQNFNNRTYYGTFKNQFEYIAAAQQGNGKIIVLAGDVMRFYNNGNRDYSFTINQQQKADFELTDIDVATDKLYMVGGNRYGLAEKYLLNNNSSTPPVVTLTAPADNAYFMEGTYIKFRAAASDTDGTIAKVEFYNGDTLLHIEYVAPYGYQWKNVAAGNYTITARATDNNGQVGISAPVYITVVSKNDFNVSIVSPVNNEVYAASAYVHLRAEVNNPHGKIERVAFYNGSILLRNDYNYPYTYFWKNVPEGVYYVTAKAIDEQGFVTKSETITIKVIPRETIVSSRPYKENEKTALKDAFYLRLTPNPATHILNIQTSGLQPDKPATLSIISISGNVLKNIQISNSSTSLDVSTLASGVYTIKITSGNKVSYKQFVKL